MSGYTPAGVVHKGEFVVPGPRYPKHWYDALLPRRIRQALNRRRHPEVEAEWLEMVNAYLKWRKA